MLVRRRGGQNGEIRPGKMMSNQVSWAKEKPLSTLKQGTVYKPRFIFESGYCSRGGYNRGIKWGAKTRYC